MRDNIMYDYNGKTGEWNVSCVFPTPEEAERSWEELERKWEEKQKKLWKEWKEWKENEVELVQCYKCGKSVKQILTFHDIIMDENYCHKCAEETIVSCKCGRKIKLINAKVGTEYVDETAELHHIRSYGIDNYYCPRCADDRAGWIDFY